MTETELNEQIAALLAASDQIDCQEGRGRRYRRRQKSLKGNRLLRMCNYGWYWSFRNRCISDCLDFEGHTLLHSGSYIKYNKNSNRQQYLKNRPTDAQGDIHFSQEKEICTDVCLTIGGGWTDYQAYI